MWFYLYEIFRVLDYCKIGDGSVIGKLRKRVKLELMDIEWDLEDGKVLEVCCVVM